MNRISFIFLSFLFIQSKGQDTLYFSKNSEKLIVKIVEINPDNIKYKRFDNLDGPNYVTQKKELNQIAFANGKKEVFASSVELKKDSVINKVAADIVNTVAADTLYFNSGKKAAGKVISISDVIKYKMVNNPDGPSYSVLKTEIKMIVFSTGLKQEFNTDNYDNRYSQNSPSLSGESIRIQGQTDAKLYYRNGGGSVGTGIVTVLSPIAGLFPAIVCSLFKPRESKLG